MSPRPGRAAPGAAPAPRASPADAGSGATGRPRARVITSYSIHYTKLYDRGKTTLKVKTADGDEYSWGPFSIAVDRSAPVLAFDKPADGEWDAASFAFDGKISDAVGVDSAEYSLDGDNWKPLPAADADPERRSGTLELDAPDGGVLARFRVLV